MRTRKEQETREASGMIDIGEAAKLYQAYCEQQKDGLLGFYHDAGVHLTREAFLVAFGSYAAKGRGCGDYPWEISAEAGGTRFFALMTDEELAEARA